MMRSEKRSDNHMGIRKYPCFMFFVFFICCFFFTNILSHGADTISANQSLSGNHTITSAGGKFELGFYKPGFNPKSLNDWNLSDYSGGCVRRTELLCGNITATNQEKDRFWEISTTRLPGFPQSVAVGSAAECESSCLNNCSCTAYAYDSNGCSIWIGELMNLQDGSGNTLYLRLAVSEFPQPKCIKGIIIGAAVGSIALEVVLVLVCVVLLKQQNRIVATPGLLWRNTSRWLSFLHEERMATVYVGSLFNFSCTSLSSRSLLKHNKPQGLVNSTVFNELILKL
ncbi:G-type lectin S-receptor-like serine/threonine-protein kinase [Camellia lanceoleosa]|uniref:G-type lectin S-receptor-like serine/threonine-protein kinase n=1 Tax=Camellia lanceoleosa TaxID=1840588 RepID=A0ACC0HER2_9ERIC|nr:G-type lectin S-receptor-like serine/threonine-protein kinase [Camellia lanceoleosa]